MTEAEFVNAWGVTVIQFVLIILSWCFIVGLVIGYRSLQYIDGGLPVVILSLGTCMLIKYFGWQALAIPIALGLSLFVIMLARYF